MSARPEPSSVTSTENGRHPKCQLNCAFRVLQRAQRQKRQFCATNPYREKTHTFPNQDARYLVVRDVTATKTCVFLVYRG